MKSKVKSKSYCLKWLAIYHLDRLISDITMNKGRFYKTHIDDLTMCFEGLYNSKKVQTINILRLWNLLIETCNPNNQHVYDDDRQARKELINYIQKKVTKWNLKSLQSIIDYKP